MLSCKCTPSNCLFLTVFPCYVWKRGSSEDHFFAPRLQVHGECCFNLLHFALSGNPAHPTSAGRNAFPPPFQLHEVLLTHLEEVHCSTCLFFLLSLIWFAFYCLPTEWILSLSSKGKEPEKSNACGGDCLLRVITVLC